MKKIETPYLHLTKSYIIYKFVCFLKIKKEEPISSIIKRKVGYLSPSKYEPIVKISRKRKSLVQLYNTNQSFEVDSNRDKKVEGIKKLLKNLNNENNLLKNKYEMLYKKYIKLLKKLRENKEFTFIEEKKIKMTKEIFPESDVIHYFYLNPKDTDIRKKHPQDNKIASCIKVKAVDITKNNPLQYRNYKDNENYSDVEFYIANEFLKRMDGERLHLAKKVAHQTITTVYGKLELLNYVTPKNMLRKF
ncbi:hypothetical protein YYE_01460 [Plasmodium vinckei vinckei]|nr:hypothetical protein YYE_01460 [Plasmodium vinckei vinckei]